MDHEKYRRSREAAGRALILRTAESQTPLRWSGRHLTSFPLLYLDGLDRSRRWSGRCRTPKNRFSEVVQRARREGPQTVTLRGVRAAVVLSAAEYDALTPQRPSLVDDLLSGPVWTTSSPRRLACGQRRRPNSHRVGPDRLAQVARRRRRLIAATAIVHDFILVTRNVSGFADTRVSLLNPWDIR